MLTARPAAAQTVACVARRTSAAGATSPRIIPTRRYALNAKLRPHLNFRARMQNFPFMCGCVLLLSICMDIVSPLPVGWRWLSLISLGLHANNGICLDPMTPLGMHSVIFCRVPLAMPMKSRKSVHDSVLCQSLGLSTVTLLHASRAHIMWWLDSWVACGVIP